MPFYPMPARQQGHWISLRSAISLQVMKTGAPLTLLTLTLSVTLSGCGPWPQVDAPERADTGAWPALLPIEDISSVSRASASPPADAQRLSARAAALRARARLMRQSVPDQDAMDAMRARLAR